MPTVRENAIAAAIFGSLMAVLFPFLQGMPMGWQTPILLVVTIGYIILMNRRLSRATPPPPTTQRKGSFKKKQTGQGWTVARWAASVMLVGMVVQLGVFLAAYMIVRGLLAWAGYG